MITIICIGKIKENYFKEAIKDYEKRIGKYHKINIIELMDINSNDQQVILNKEKELIMKQLPNRSYIITLEIEGKSINSPQFAKKIDDLFIRYSNIVFIVGGSYGLHLDIKKMSNESLSFSELTFPHQLFRVILLEQIYRCFKINNNETYHK